MSPRKHVVGHETHRLRFPRNYCFACGLDNAEGMRMKFYLDERRGRFVSRFRLAKRYQGPPGHAHGGIVATVLDEAMGKVNKLRQVVALTSRIEVQYLKPVPLGKPLVVESHEVSVRGRRHTNAAEIRNRKGEILARSKGIFIAIDPERMFARHLTAEQRRYLRQARGGAGDVVTAGLQRPASKGQ